MNYKLVHLRDVHAFRRGVRCSRYVARDRHVIGQDRFLPSFLDRGQLPPTNLTCSAVDQAALYGLLRKVRDLGLPLISVTRAQTDQIPFKGRI